MKERNFVQVQSEQLEETANLQVQGSNLLKRLGGDSASSLKRRVSSRSKSYSRPKLPATLKLLQHPFLFQSSSVSKGCWWAFKRKEVLSASCCTAGGFNDHFPQSHFRPYTGTKGTLVWSCYQITLATLFRMSEIQFNFLKYNILYIT